MGIPTLKSTHKHNFLKKEKHFQVGPSSCPFYIESKKNSANDSQGDELRRIIQLYSDPLWKGGPCTPPTSRLLGGRLLWRCVSRQMPSQMHQARLCRDRWDTVCYNWQQSPWASSENLTLAKHILHSRAAHPGDTKWGRGLGGRRQRRKYRSRMPGAAPKDAMLQKLPHPHRQTKPTKPSLQAAAEESIKSSSISNLLHHGKIQTTPSNLESLKVFIFILLFPHTHTLTSPMKKNFLGGKFAGFFRSLTILWSADGAASSLEFRRIC